MGMSMTGEILYLYLLYNKTSAFSPEEPDMAGLKIQSGLL